MRLRDNAMPFDSAAIAFKWRLFARSVAGLGASALTLGATSALADEGGIGFWLPGSVGSLAAVPGEPGLSWATIYYHNSADAGAGQEFAQGGEIRAGVDGRADIVLFGPSYAFENPILDGQLSLSALTGIGHSKGTVDATLTGPNGNTVSGEASDTVTGFADIFLQATMKWNDGVNNYMAYAMTSLPVGTYEEDRLANLGLGHSAVDGGVGYTYFNPTTGHEFSAIAGLTYNFENEHTDYQNGIDFHLDVAASQFLSETLQIGLAGYAYQQLTGDSGSGAVLGDFESRVFGVGPQFGVFFPVGNMQGYFNAKAFYEFEAENRAEGWNAWVTFAVSPAAHQGN